MSIDSLFTGGAVNGGLVTLITTDIRLFPYTNTDDLGFLIPVPKHSGGEAKYGISEEKHYLSERI